MWQAPIEGTRALPLHPVTVRQPPLLRRKRRILTQTEASESNDIEDGPYGYDGDLFSTLGGQDYFEEEGLTSFTEWTTHHVFTRYGIKGRDTLRTNDS